MPAAPGPVGLPPAPAPSLFASLRIFWRTLLATFHTRLDLFTTELSEEGFRLLNLVISSAIALLALHTAFFFLMLLILAAVWDTPARLWVIAGIGLLYLLIGVAALVIARNLIFNRPRFLGQTLDELKRDVEGLHTALKPRGEEEKS
jgi:uncharacterized membrane protein YqjE